jgi:hypothetical protein
VNQCEDPEFALAEKIEPQEIIALEELAIPNM